VTLQSAEQDWPDQHLTIKLPTTVWASEHHIVLPPTAARRTPPTPVTGRASLAHYTGSAESASADRPSPQDEPNPADRPSPQDEPNPADRPSSQDEPASADKPTPPSTSSTGTTVIDPATASKQPKHRKVGRTRWNPFRQG